MRAGQYALLRGDDPDFYLPDTPIAAPGRGVEEDTPEDDPIMAEWEEFDRACDSIVPALGADPATGWALVDACLRIPDEGRWSWDRDRKGLYYFEEWLCDRLGRMIAAQGQAR